MAIRVWLLAADDRRISKRSWELFGAGESTTGHLPPIPRSASIVTDCSRRSAAGKPDTYGRLMS